jgi:hypothetical protein
MRRKQKGEVVLLFMLLFFVAGWSVGANYDVTIKVDPKQPKVNQVVR